MRRGFWTGTLACASIHRRTPRSAVAERGAGVHQRSSVLTNRRLSFRFDCFHLDGAPFCRGDPLREFHRFADVLGFDEIETTDLLPGFRERPVFRGRRAVVSLDGL